MESNENDYFPDDYISKDNTSVSSENKEENQKEITKLENKENLEKYGISKPKRIIIKAKIINDKD